MAAKPVILPEPYSGDSKSSKWDEWVTHFKNCAEVNNWDGDAKLKFLKVQLTGRAQTAFQRLPDDQKGTFDDAVAALTECFEPKSKRDLYVAELLTREKLRVIGRPCWGTEADSHPDLGATTAEQLALTHYLRCIHDIQLALPVKQKSLTSLHEAVSYTIQIESFLLTCLTQPSINVARAEPTEATQLPADAVTVKPPLDKFTEMVEKLGKCLDNIESTLQRPPQGNCRPPRPHPRDTPVVCLKCHQTGHFARGRVAPRSPKSPPPTGNWWPSGERVTLLRVWSNTCQPTGNTISITPINPVLTLHVDLKVFWKSSSHSCRYWSCYNTNGFFPLETKWHCSSTASHQAQISGCQWDAIAHTWINSNRNQSERN